MQREEQKIAHTIKEWLKDNGVFGAYNVEQGEADPQYVMVPPDRIVQACLATHPEWDRALVSDCVKRCKASYPSVRVLKDSLLANLAD